MSATTRAIKRDAARARDERRQIVSGWSAGGVLRDDANRPKRDDLGEIERVDPVDARLVTGPGLTLDFRGGRRG